MAGTHLVGGEGGRPSSFRPAGTRRATADEVVPVPGGGSDGEVHVAGVRPVEADREPERRAELAPVVDGDHTGEARGTEAGVTTVRPSWASPN